MRKFKKRLVSVALSSVLAVGTMGAEVLAQSETDFASVFTDASEESAAEAADNVSAKENGFTQDGIFSSEENSEENLTVEEHAAEEGNPSEAAAKEQGASADGMDIFLEEESGSILEEPGDSVNEDLFFAEETTEAQPEEAFGSEELFTADSVTSNGWTYKVSSSGLTITAYSGSATNVTIPSSLDGYKVTSIGSKAFADKYTIKTVTIPETITSIGSEAFFGCAGLSTINFNAKNCTIPDVWIYDGNKGAGVFSGAGSASASGLTVNFGAGVTKVPNGLFNTASTTEYGKKGYPYAYVTAVNFTNSTTEIGDYAFFNCKELSGVKLGSNVTTIGTAAFAGCSSMTSLVTTNALTAIGDSAFADCTSLKSVTWGTGLGKIGVKAFSNCISLTSLSLPNPLNTIDRNAFESCTGLASLTLPKSLTNLNAEAFYGCIKLNTITVNSTNLKVPDVWIYDSNKGVGVFSGAGSASPTGLTVNFGSGVTKVPNGLFNTASTTEYGKKGYPYAYVTAINFADSVKEIGDYAFYNCQELTKVKLGNGIAVIGQYAFWNCIKVTDLTAAKALTTIGDYAFSGCTSLKNIQWSSGLNSIGINAFSKCSGLTSLSIPDPVTTIERNAFSECTGLVSLTLPKSLTSLKAEAFYNCIKLSNITINSANLTVPEVWIYDSNKGVGVFSGAGSASSSGLSVTFGSGVTRICDYLFDTASTTEYGRKGYPYAYVTSVKIPASVTYIGKTAFRNCQNLGTVTITSVKAEFGNDVFVGCTSSSFKIEGYYGGTAVAYAASHSHPYAYLPPSKPVLSGAAKAATGVNVSWKNAVGAQGYIVYRKTSGGSAWTQLAKITNGSTSYTDTNVKSGTTYVYTVGAYVGSLRSGYDNAGKSITYLSRPSVSSLTNTASGVKIKWSKVSGASGYYVYRGSKKIKTITSGSTVSYTDTAVKSKNGTKYQYKVVAYKTVSGKAKTSMTSPVKTVYRVTAPGLSSVKNNAGKKMTVKWGKNSKATGYQIQYSTKSNFSGSKSVSVSGVSNVSKVISGLSKGKTYYVRIRAYKTVSGTKYYSDWSSKKSTKISK